MAAGTENLWGALLRESSKRSKYPASVCVLLGDAACDKSQVTGRLCAGSGEEQPQTSPSILAYDYFSVEDVESESPLRVNMWTLHDTTFDGAFDAIYRPVEANESPARLCFMIALDLSTGPECLTSLQKWLVRVQHYCRRYHAVLGPQASRAATGRHAHHLANARRNKGAVSGADDEAAAAAAAASSSSSTSSSAAPLWQTLGVPIIVVGTRADHSSAVATDVSALKQSQQLQGQMRLLCLQVGAALVYTTSADANNSSSSNSSSGSGSNNNSSGSSSNSSSGEGSGNLALLKRYLTHRLYPEALAVPDLHVEEGLQGAFVPSGFDSAELVLSATGVQGGEAVLLEDPAAPASSSSSSSAAMGTAAGAGAVEVEGEQEWLAGLHAYMLQVTAGTAAAPPAAAASVAPPAAAAASSAAPSSLPAAAGGAEASKRAARTPAAPQKKEDVDDFFKSLLGAKK